MLQEAVWLCAVVSFRAAVQVPGRRESHEKKCGRQQHHDAEEVSSLCRVYMAEVQEKQD